MALFDLNRAQGPQIATLKLSTIVPKNWRRFPPRIGSITPAYVPTVTYAWPYNGIPAVNPGDDVNVATANATGEYYPRNQGNKANMLGDANALAVDITEPAGWVGPQEPYAAPATPTLGSLVPPSRVVAPTADLSLTINGTNFMPSSQIKIAGHFERVTYVSPTQLKTIINGNVFTGPDPAIPVQVVNGGKVSNTLNFAITAV